MARLSFIRITRPIRDDIHKCQVVFIEGRHLNFIASTRIYIYDICRMIYIGQAMKMIDLRNFIFFNQFSEFFC